MSEHAMNVKLMCERDRHTLCGGYNCSCPCHPGTPEERAAKADTAVRDFVTEFTEVTNSAGRHEGHTLRQVGRCVWCSCGFRYQGSLPSKRACTDSRDDR
jgi:hypothetical protein